MADEKKIKNEELTDEQVNAAAGGFVYNEYQCQGGCGRKYSGKVQANINRNRITPLEEWTTMRDSNMFDLNHRTF